MILFRRRALWVVSRRAISASASTRSQPVSHFCTFDVVLVLFMVYNHSMEPKDHPVIKAAEDELESLLTVHSDLKQQTAENSKKISAVMRTIDDLRHVYGLPPKKTLAEQLGESYESQTLGLTDQIREVLGSRHPNWLPPMVVKAYLERRGFPIGDYVNPMAVVHQVLRRLDDQGFAESDIIADGGKVYRAKRMMMGTDKGKVETTIDPAPRKRTGKDFLI